LKHHPQHSVLTLLQKRLRFQTHYPIRVNSLEVMNIFLQSPKEADLERRGDLAWETFFAEARRLASLARTRQAARQPEARVNTDEE